MFMRVKRCEKCSHGRLSPRRIAHMFLKEKTLFGKLIDIWRCWPGISVAAEVVSPQRICNNYENVGGIGSEKLPVCYVNQICGNQENPTHGRDFLRSFGWICFFFREKEKAED